MLILIPAHDEAQSLPATVAELRRELPEADILVVDDGSRDDTPAVIRALGVRYLRLPMCLGVGTATRAGLRYARHLGQRLVVRVDADGQHAAGDIARLAACVRDGSVDAAVGSRYLEADGYRARALRRVVQRLLAFALSRVTGRRVTDPTSGFWVFGARVLDFLAEHHPSGFAEPELRLLLARHRFVVGEVAVTMRARTAGRSSLRWHRAAGAVARAMLALVVTPLRRVP